MRLYVESAFLPTHWPSLGGTIRSENEPCRVNGCCGEATPASREKLWDFSPGKPATRTKHRGSPKPERTERINLSMIFNNERYETVAFWDKYKHVVNVYDTAGKKGDLSHCQQKRRDRFPRPASRWDQGGGRHPRLAYVASPFKRVEDG